LDVAKNENESWSPFHGAALILVRPKYPENIGAAARIGCNFGISELRLVNDVLPDQERMLKMATHKAAHLIRNLQLFETSRQATEPFQFIVGTTARTGRNRILEQSPRQVMTELAPLAISNRIALMFGPENTGLTNEDLDLCQFTSTIPTSDFSSLNLAQAVAIHCYELFTSLPADHIPPGDSDYANSFDLEGMYEHIEKALEKITFLRDSNHIYWMRNIRQFLGRQRLRKKDASIIRGVCRKFLWYDSQHRNLPPSDLSG
jgi:tRNA/rRNA methyltransferase